MSEITARIDSLLSERNKKRSDLCRETDIPESSFRGWVRGSIPNAEYAIKVAHFFGVSVEWLINGDNGDDSCKLVLAPEEKELIEIFRRLSSEQKKFILSNARFIMEQKGNLDTRV